MLLNCILIAATSAHPQIIQTAQTRVLTTVPTLIYRCPAKLTRNVRTLPQQKPLNATPQS
jgi:hypothetical protein